jgi:hypothetical protein
MQGRYLPSSEVELHRGGAILESDAPPATEVENSSRQPKILYSLQSRPSLLLKNSHFRMYDDDLAELSSGFDLQDVDESSIIALDFERSISTLTQVSREIPALSSRRNSSSDVRSSAKKTNCSSTYNMEVDLTLEMKEEESRDDSKKQ